MKLNPIIFVLLFFFSCKNIETGSDNAQATPDKAASDAGAGSETGIYARAVEIDSTIKALDIATKRNKPERYRPNIYSEKDIVVVMNHEDELYRIGTSMFPPGAETRSIFYYVDGQLAQYKFREWQQETNPPRAKEIICYLDDDGIFLAQQRTIELGPGSNPGPLLGEPLVDITKDREALMQALNTDLETIKKGISASK